MNTKTCKGCGWVYPLITPYATCRFCGRSFTEGICPKCGKYSDDLISGYNICRACLLAYKRTLPKTPDDPASQRARHAKMCKAIDDRFKKWCERLKGISTHTLTESEWLEACRYFNGCAFCDNEEVSTRGYFIRFEDGGKYNACNVVPMCEKCATEHKIQHNPFRRLNPSLNNNLELRRGLSKAKLENVVDYLQAKMEGIENEQQS